MVLIAHIINFLISGAGGVLSRARVEESEVRLRESDLIVGAKNEEDMTFILMDQSTKTTAFPGISVPPSLSLERWWWGGASRELVAQCGSSFSVFFFSVVLFFVLFFVVQGGVHSIGPLTHMYIMYIYCTPVYIL